MICDRCMVAGDLVTAWRTGELNDSWPLVLKAAHFHHDRCRGVGQCDCQHQITPGNLKETKR